MDREYGKKYDSVKRASANRLNLIKNMSGDLFCIIDGDDYYCDVNFVEQAVKIYEKNCDISKPLVIMGTPYKWLILKKSCCLRNIQIKL